MHTIEKNFNTQREGKIPNKGLIRPNMEFCRV